ncbi:MAG TPA: M23 family metallopeptidase [Candidatus Dormibacteraeota bacterium]
MTLLGAARLGWLAWSWRRPVLLLFIAAILLPLLLAAFIVGAQGQSPAGLTSPVGRGTLTQPFGCTLLGIEPWSEACPAHHFHSGIDLAAAMDAPIYAATSGVVLVARQRGGYGLYMVVTQDPRLSTLYAHLDFPLVQTGERVAGGQQIGLMGSSGNSTGPHLHFEVRLAGVPVDPLPLLPGVARGGGR